GQSSPFVHMTYPQAIALTSGSDYGENLYVATRVRDSIYRIDANGSIKRFGNFPGEHPGGPVDLCFDTDGACQGLLYIANDSRQRPDLSGVFSIDPEGNATRFAEAIVAAYSIEMAPMGDFDKGMYVAGKVGSFDDPHSLWYVNPDGRVSEFARVRLDATGLLTFTFGPDGSMYIPEYLVDYKVVIVSRVVPRFK
ncbi:MAG: lactonase family protein, partial [Desulfobacterales bacterium]|nr:lactonase family protein [Desulfobacterales bacterium]